MDVRGEADPCDRPQKMESKNLISSMSRSYSEIQEIANHRQALQ
jgi:hypothetical protein